MENIVYVYGGLGFFEFILLLFTFWEVRRMRRQNAEYLDALLARLTQQVDDAEASRPRLQPTDQPR